MPGCGLVPGKTWDVIEGDRGSRIVSDSNCVIGCAKPSERRPRRRRLNSNSAVFWPRVVANITHHTLPLRPTIYYQLESKGRVNITLLQLSSLSVHCTPRAGRSLHSKLPFQSHFAQLLWPSRSILILWKNTPPWKTWLKDQNPCPCLGRRVVDERLDGRESVSARVRQATLFAHHLGGNFPALIAPGRPRSVARHGC